MRNPGVPDGGSQAPEGGGPTPTDEDSGRPKDAGLDTALPGDASDLEPTGAPGPSPAEPTPPGAPYLGFQAWYEAAGIACRTVAVDELRKAAGGIGCLTGVLERAQPA